QAWPFVGQYLEKLLVETIAPAIRASSIHLQTLNFTKVNLGEKAWLQLFLLNTKGSLNSNTKKCACLSSTSSEKVLVEKQGKATSVCLHVHSLCVPNIIICAFICSAMSDTMIMDAIASHLVLPNRLTIPLVADLHVAQLRSPLPRGVVRIHLLEAEDLTAKDTVIKGLIDGKSDPYAVLRVGTQIFTSHHVDNNLNPQWREMYEWFNLRDVPSGSVHLRLEWLSLLSSADRLSETCYGTNNPVWEDAFTFFIQDPRKQDIDIQVKDDDRAFPLGSLTIPLSRLLESHELTLDQWFHLENPGLASRLYAKIVLRVCILCTDSCFLPVSGVLRIHLMEAQNLIAKDNFMGGMVKGKSDPYVKIRVAGITFRSHTIKENLNPVWNELYEVILTQLPGQEIQFELFDKDIDQDDFLGRVTDLPRLEQVRYLHCPFLKIYKSNRFCLLLQQFNNNHKLRRVLHYQSQQSYQNKVVPSAAVLFVYVERAHGLPVRLRSLGVYWGQTLGSLTVLLREVLSEPGLMLDKWFSLDGALPESQILLRVTLKVP
ncbi:hypothetical protein XENOCAPTIV_026342, partial [Xenoophorus captivus]